MKKTTPQDGMSTDIIAENLKKIRDLVPEAFVGGEVDLEVIAQALGVSQTHSDRSEKFGLTWHGKNSARQISLTPSTGTLLPRPNISKDWNDTQNILIEGDNLEAMKLLQKSYAGKVDIVYIDPPYNTGNEFIYPDKFRDNLDTYLKYTGQIDSEGGRLSSKIEKSGRQHASWLNMMYPRLKLARNLLSEKGAIFISIDDHEASHLKQLCDEIFGETNFKANVSWQKRYTRSNNTIDFTTIVEHILVYSKSEHFVVNLLPRNEEADARYSNPDNDLRGVWKGASFLNPATPAQRPNLCYEIVNPNTGQRTLPTKNAWRRSFEAFQELEKEGKLYWGSDGKSPVPSIKMFLSEARGLTPTNFWDHHYAGNTDEGTRDCEKLFGEKVFDNPKPVKLIKRVLEHAGDKDSIVLDFFSGSGTTGQAVMEKNLEDAGSRKFICIQLPENIGSKENAFKLGYQKISEVTMERLRRAGQIYEKLANEKIDVGFKAFELSSSNIRAWDPNPIDLEETLLSHREHLVDGRTEQDVLYELLLKRGIELTVPIEERQAAGKTMYSIGYGVLFACLDTSIAAEDVVDVAQGVLDWHKELAPETDTYVFFRDSAFSDDIAKTNMAAILDQNGISHVRSL